MVGSFGIDSTAHIQPGSPLIDAGDPTNFAPTDIDGETRPKGGLPDCGADEGG